MQENAYLKLVGLAAPNSYFAVPFEEDERDFVTRMAEKSFRQQGA